MKKLYTINELCQLTLVSVRTLHYYDEIQILKPSHRTKNGHRLYSQHDLLTLQQISTFKFLGFSLAQIKKLLLDDKLDALQSLKMQAQALAEEADRIKNVSNFFSYFINQYDTNQTCDWEIMTKIMSVFKQKETDTQEWYKNYLSKMEMHQFSKFVKTRNEKWTKLLEEIKNNINSNPESEIGATLVKKWMSLADEAYGDYPKLREKLWEAYKARIIPEDYFPYDENVVSYLSKAFEWMKNNYDQS